MTYRFFVEGVPKAWARPKARNNGGYFSPTKYTSWHRSILFVASGAKPPKPMDGPVRVTITFFMPMPKRRPNGASLWVDKRPDIDNLGKEILDAIGETKKWFSDDGQVAQLNMSKRYAYAPHNVGAEIALDQICEPK